VSADPLTWAFAAGSAAALTPCGFAVLPAYLGYQLGRDAGTARAAGAAHGLARGVAMAAGVVTLFALMGWAVGLARALLLPVLPWLAALVGVALVAIGGVLLARPAVSLELPGAGALARAAPSDRTWRATYLFGMGYGAASLGCTLPIFLAIAAQSLATRSPAQAVAVFLAYGAGMGWLLTLVALAASVGNTVVVHRLRPFMGWVRTAGAAGMIVAGGHLVYYSYSRGMLTLRV
jgi:cytochrome c-type biogenesis protein